MKLSTKNMILSLSATLTLALAATLPAQEPEVADDGSTTTVTFPLVSPEARAVLERMATYLQGLQTYSIKANASRDEVVALGYKLQKNEQSELIVHRPNRLRAEVAGDIRDRTFVYDGASLTMYSPDDAVYVRTPAPDTLAEMLGRLLDMGVEMPLIDVLYKATDGTLTENVIGGILVGQSTIDGVECDHLAFRQVNIDWQLWVERGDRPLPRKMLITTRYEVGDPQYEATLQWNLKPKIHSSTFAFSPPKGVTEIPLDERTSIEGDAP